MDALAAGLSRLNSLFEENSKMERISLSLKDETTEIKTLIGQSQMELRKLLLKPENEESIVNTVEIVKKLNRKIFTPTKSVRINSTRSDGSNVTRNKGSTAGIVNFSLRFNFLIHLPELKGSTTSSNHSRRNDFYSFCVQLFHRRG